jgi:hypothetical protein
MVLADGASAETVTKATIPIQVHSRSLPAGRARAPSERQVARGGPSGHPMGDVAPGGPIRARRVRSALSPGPWAQHRGADPESAWMVTFVAGASEPVRKGRPRALIPVRSSHRWASVVRRNNEQSPVRHFPTNRRAQP